MAHDVFISYSSKDKAIADAVCAKLESEKIRCWIAPRDVAPGQPYAASLVNAISESRVIVLVLSEGSNKSDHVLRELSEAVDHGIPIMPLRIQDIQPSSEMRFYIKSIHWLDAMSPPLERHLGRLTESVQALLSVGEDRPSVRVAQRAEIPTAKRSTFPVWTIAIISLAVVLAIAGIGGWVYTQFLLASSSKPQLSNKITFESQETDQGLPRTQESSPFLTDTQVATSGQVTMVSNVETTTPAPSPSLSEEEWRTLTFNIPSETLWLQKGTSYTSIARPSQDTITWSDEIIEGDFILTAEVAHLYPNGEGEFIVYGDGVGFSNGCLIFTYGQGLAVITKHTLYHQGENWLVVNEGDFYFTDAIRVFTINITGDKADFYVDDQKVAFTFLPSDINRRGRIGLNQHWEVPAGVTYSKIKIKTLSNDE